MAIIRAPKKSKWYVVWIGHSPGIYPSWEKCRPQVEGFPGSRYRAYDTLAEARAAFDAGPPNSPRKSDSGKPANPADEDEPAPAILGANDSLPSTRTSEPTSNDSHPSAKHVAQSAPQPHDPSHQPQSPTKRATQKTAHRSAAGKTPQQTNPQSLPPNKHVQGSASAKTAGRGPIYPSVSVDAACNMETRVMEYRGVDTQTGRELFRMGPYNGATNNMGEFLALVHALSLLAKQKNPIPVYSDSKTALAWVRNKHAKTTVNRTAANRKVFELLDRAEAWLRENTFPNRVLKWETDKWGENPADFGRK